MEQTLRQLGGLLLGSVPTVLMLSLLYLVYRTVLHRPLEKVLAERRSKTEGAVEKARADIAAAEARTAEYQQRLREARMAVFKSRDARRQKALQARATVVATTRQKAQEQVSQSRAAIEQDKQAALSNLEGEAQRLAAEIIRSVLRPVAPARRPPWVEIDDPAKGDLVGAKAIWEVPHFLVGGLGVGHSGRGFGGCAAKAGARTRCFHQ